MPEFNKTNIKELLHNRIVFINKLLLIILLIGKALLKKTELNSIIYYNDPDIGFRHIIINYLYKYIQINIDYTKSYNITKKSNHNIKFLLLRLNNILKTYLLIFIPFYC